MDVPLGGAEIHAAVLDRFEAPAKQCPLNSLRYDLRKLKGHGLLEREAGRYAYRLTEEGQRVAVLFLLFHQRLCGPVAGGQFGRRPSNDTAREACWSGRSIRRTKPLMRL